MLPIGNKVRVTGCNRDIVECKDTFRFVENGSYSVVIETLWNVKKTSMPEEFSRDAL